MKLPAKKFDDPKDVPAEFDSREAWPNCESLREVRD
jgi:hypothetical protein